MYAVLQCLVIGIMLFSQLCIKDRTSDNVIMRDQDCRVGAVSLLIKISAGFCSAHAHVKLRLVMEGEYTLFFCGTIYMKASIRIS